MFPSPVCSQTEQTSLTRVCSAWHSRTSSQCHLVRAGKSKPVQPIFSLTTDQTVKEESKMGPSGRRTKIQDLRESTAREQKLHPQTRPKGSYRWEKCLIGFYRVKSCSFSRELSFRSDKGCTEINEGASQWNTVKRLHKSPTLKKKKKKQELCVLASPKKKCKKDRKEENDKLKNVRVPLMKSDDQLQTDAQPDFIRFYSHPLSLSLSLSLCCRAPFYFQQCCVWTFSSEARRLCITVRIFSTVSPPSLLHTLPF